MIADRYDAFLFDLDGVLYRGAQPIEGAAGTLATLRRLGKGLAFMTNNSSRTPEAIAAHLTGLGIEARPDEVETSALATAELLRSRAIASAYVVGDEGLRTALAAAGLTVLDGTAAAAETVVVGWDRGFDYAELATAYPNAGGEYHFIGRAFGRVPAFPASPFSALAHIGPIARSVEDTALMLSIIGRPDARDFMAWNTPCPDYTIGLARGVAGMRIAYSPKLGLDVHVDPDIASACEKAAQTFVELGANVEVADPKLPDCRAIIDTLWKAVATFIRNGIPADQRMQCDCGFLRDAEMGAKVPTGRYIAASAERADVALAMARFHEDYDLLLTPQMPLPAIAAGHDVPPGSEMNHWIDWSPFTYPFNITQQPAASVPCGFTRDSLPIGLQIVGPSHEDARVLAAARAFENAQPFARIEAARN